MEPDLSDWTDRPKKGVNLINDWFDSFFPLLQVYIKDIPKKKKKQGLK
jgi:hypothetical protein